MNKEIQKKYSEYVFEYFFKKLFKIVLKQKKYSNSFNLIHLF